MESHNIKHKTLILGCLLFSKTKRKIIAKHPETPALKNMYAAENELSYAVVTKRFINKKVKLSKSFNFHIYLIHSIYPLWNTEFRNIEIINTVFIKNFLWRLGRQSVKKQNKFRKSAGTFETFRKHC